MAPKKARGAKRNSKKRAASVACALDEALLITSDVQSQDDTAKSPGTAETDLDNSEKPEDADECSESVKRKQRKVRDRLNLSQEQEEHLAKELLR